MKTKKGQGGRRSEEEGVRRKEEERARRKKERGERKSEEKGGDEEERSSHLCKTTMYVRLSVKEKMKLFRTHGVDHLGLVRTSGLSPKLPYVVTRFPSPLSHS